MVCLLYQWSGGTVGQRNEWNSEAAGRYPLSAYRWQSSRRLGFFSELVG